MVFLVGSRMGLSTAVRMILFRLDGELVHNVKYIKENPELFPAIQVNLIKLLLKGTGM